jgi:Prasinovirus endonuclease VII
MPLSKYVMADPVLRKAAQKADYDKRRDKILAQKKEKAKDPAEKARVKAYAQSPERVKERKAKDKARYANDATYRELLKGRSAKARSTVEGAKKNKEASAKYRKANPGKIKARAKLLFQKSKPKINAYFRKYKKKRFATDPAFKVTEYMRRRVRLALKGTPKAGTTENLVGCSWQELRAHLESMFLPGMGWHNHSLSGWHIDHKRPCASFDLSDPAQQRLCFHYTNLQPLWAADNQKKGDSYTEPQEELKEAA